MKSIKIIFKWENLKKNAGFIIMILFLLIFIISFFCYYLSLVFSQIGDFIEKVIEKKTLKEIFGNSPTKETIKTETDSSSGEEIEEDDEEDENDDGKKSLFSSSSTIKYKTNYDKDNVKYQKK